MDLKTRDLCVTYLNLNDFKRTVATWNEDKIRLPQKTKIMAGIALSTGKHRKMTGLLRRTVLQDGRAMSSTGQSTSYEATFRRAISSRHGLVQSYPFLAYASTYWLHHGKSIDQGVQRSRAWDFMVGGSHTVALTPWSETQWQQRDHSIIEWAVEHEHYRLLRRAILSTVTLRQAPFERMVPTKFGSHQVRMIGLLAKLSKVNLFNEYLLSCHGSPSKPFFLGAVKLRGHTEMVETLIHALSEYYTPYRLSILRNPRTVLNSWISQTTVPFSKLMDGLACQPADIAAVVLQLLRFGNLEVREPAARYLLQNHPSLASHRFSGHEDTVMESAIKSGNNWALCYILRKSGLEEPSLWIYSRGHSVNIPNTDLNISDACHLAIDHFQWRVAKSLLKYGADPNSLGARGMPLLYCFILHSKQSLQKADTFDYGDIVEFILESGGDPNWKDDRGDTVLHLLTIFALQEPDNQSFRSLFLLILEKSKFPIRGRLRNLLDNSILVTTSISYEEERISDLPS